MKGQAKLAAALDEVLRAVEQVRAVALIADQVATENLRRYPCPASKRAKRETRRQCRSLTDLNAGLERFQADQLRQVPQLMETLATAIDAGHRARRQANASAYMRFVC